MLTKMEGPLLAVVVAAVVFVYTRWNTVGAVKDTRNETRHDETAQDKEEGDGDNPGDVRQKKRRKQKGRTGGEVVDDPSKSKSKPNSKPKSKDGDEDEEKGRDSADDQNGSVVPGGFDTAARASLAGTASKPGDGARPDKRKKKKKKKAQGKVGDEDEDGAEMHKEVGATAEDSSDADVSVSHSPSVSGSTARMVPGKATLRADTRSVPPARNRVRGHAPSQARALSFDTDGSWTHVDRRKTSRTTDGQITRLVDAVDATSSDLASIESNSPVADRNESDASDIRGTRADLARVTLAERLVPRPEETIVDDMLDQPNVGTLAHVIRVQSWADETPLPGFSWDDYGTVEDSVLVLDANQEDEGEWGIVKSRSRTWPQATRTTSVSQVAAAPEPMTKKQRQNARKRVLAKAAKAEQETARLQGLEKHKRELERLRIIEQSRQGGKQLSGGMHAAVDDRGKLVWE